jgi:ABC-type Fe3+-hydroxamate transport system substrate-binding protein
MSKGPTLYNSIFIDDNVADVARALGCYAKAMVGGQVPMVETAFPFAKQLECILCVMGPKRKLLYSAYRRMNISSVVIAHTDSDPNPASIAPELRENGLNVEVIDFTKGVPHAIREAGRVFEREKAAEKLAVAYERDMESVYADQPMLGRRVLVLLGITNPQRPERYLLLETPGCYLDQSILAPLGCVNAGAAQVSPDTEIVMDGIQIIDGPLDLAAMRPDTIALTGDPLVGQRALRDAVAANPHLRDCVPALKKYEVYSLPHCCSAEPLRFPETFRLWKEALSR